MLILTFALGGQGASAQSPKPSAGGVAGLGAQPGQMTGNEITPQQQRAVERGLAFLASRQTREGAFGGGGGVYGRHAGITALGGLAFMSAGNLPGRGRYGDNVQKCLDFILGAVQPTGLISSDQSHGAMYGHGFAALFLAEVYGMTGDDAIKDKLQKAITLIIKVQNKEGGWRYQPAPLDADISVTIAQVMALRAARDAGIKVPKDTIDAAVAYVRRCQNKDGGFNYVAGQGGGGSGFARSGAGVSALYYAGVFEGDDLKRGLDYLMKFVPGKGKGDATADGHYFYGHYYTVQAMFLAGGDYWAQWYPAIRDQLIARQNSQGGWNDGIGEDYATAMALIILQMPNRYLPVFHGKGPGS